MQALSRPSLATSLLLALAFVTAPALAATHHDKHSKKEHASKSAAARKGAPAKKGAAAKKKGAEPKKAAAAKTTHGPLADLRNVQASKDVVQVANWVSYTYDSKQKPFVIIDKKAAHMYVFDGWGRLWGSSPVLVGKAVGDDTAPGVGSKRLSQLKPHEKTTPAGRFIAERGKDNHGANVVWIDYDAALSMHATASVSASERRAERMATPEPDDNRISNGCINVPPKFFNGVLWPTMNKTGAVVYVLPETRTPQQQFGAYDVKADRKGVA